MPKTVIRVIAHHTCHSWAHLMLQVIKVASLRWHYKFIKSYVCFHQTSVKDFLSSQIIIDCHTAIFAGPQNLQRTLEKFPEMQRKILDKFFYLLDLSSSILKLSPEDYSETVLGIQTLTLLRTIQPFQSQEWLTSIFSWQYQYMNK